MSTSRFIQYILLISIASALIYLAWYIQIQELTDVTVSNGPLIELHQFEVIRYETNGTKEYSLTGSYSEHYNGEKGTYIDNPFVTRFLDNDPEKIDWTAESLNAVISQDRNLIEMNEKVRLISIDYDKEKETTTLNTSQLLIHEHGEKITSDKFITIDAVNRHMEGVGLIGYPRIGQYTLLKDTITTYETTK